MTSDAFSKLLASDVVDVQALCESVLMFGLPDEFRVDLWRLALRKQSGTELV